MNIPGSFAVMCRCGKELCGKHVAEAASDRVVLPSHSRPIKYNVDLSLRIEDEAFDGVVTVDIAVLAATASISLHAKDLTFTEAFINDKKATVETNDELTTVTFGSEAVLMSGTVAKLKVIYSGILGGNMCGLYKSTYTNLAGEKKTMACSQFESIDARRCIPCWDEPVHKATFLCSLTVPAYMQALSNMPESKVKHFDTGKQVMKTVHFMESPKMSTYLLAFVVGEFDYVSRLTKNGVLIRCFAPPGKPELGEFSLHCAVAALDKYDDTFALPYPLPKLDMVAIPDFAAGAMENWGLVTYREVDMLIDSANASSRQLQRVAEVVIHELAHQWFGNLVTMEWWDGLWLNEGFATFLETQVCAALYPDWELWSQFIMDMQGRALSLDALKSSHPIQVPISRAEDVEQVFDAISYCKGGSVIRMAEAWLGQQDFLTGLRAYIEEFQYGNTNTSDLWAAWEKASTKKWPVSKVLTQWTTQTGFPLIEVHSFKDGQYLVLSQRRFLADGSTAPEEKNETDGSVAVPAWTIPIFVQAAGLDRTLVDLLPANTESMQLSAQVQSDWIKLNAGQFVPCRVKYPAEMIPALAQAIKSKQLPAEDRIGLLGDTAALSRAGLVEAEVLLQIFCAFEAEDDDVVLSVLIGELIGFSKMLLRGGLTELRSLFDAMARRLLKPHLDALGWEPKDTDAHLARKLRGELIAALPTFYAADTDVVAEARRRYTVFNGAVLNDDASLKSALPSEYQSTVYKLVLANAQDPAACYNDLMTLYEKLDLNEEKKAILIGLGASPTPELRTKVLDLALSDTVKLQDYFYVALSMHSSSVEGRDATWSHFQANLEKYKVKVGDAGSSILDASITASASGFASWQAADNISAFFKNNPLPRNSRKIEQTVEGVITSAKYIDAIKSSSALDWLQNAQQK